MSNFKVTLTKILRIDPIEGADQIELATIMGYQSIVKKSDNFEVGSWVIYIPESAVVPDDILKKIGLDGKLAGSNKNRVKAIKLRGCLSQGIILRPYEHLTQEQFEDAFSSCGRNEDPDLSEILGITKYEPPVPAQFAGEVGAYLGKTLRYDIENFKGHPFVLMDNEDVVFTEKIHGTFTLFGQYPGLNDPELIDGNILISSKGLSAKGLVIKNVPANAGNIYIRAFHNNTLSYMNDSNNPITRNLFERIRATLKRWMSGDNPIVIDENTPIYVCGETFGSVQDLKYGCVPGEIQFRVFDIYVGEPGKGYYLNFDDKRDICESVKLDMVPVLYRGPFSQEKMKEFTDGKETVSGQNLHIREGIVITPTTERTDGKLGRVILKSVSGDYLVRKDKNATEFN